jgi:iron-sulfur cluster assembly protein
MIDILNPIKLSDRAIREIENIILTKSISGDYGLRVGLKGAGCGATYLLGFDLKTKADDVFEVGNIKIYIDRKHLMYLVGVEIDFEEGDEGKGFTFMAAEKVENL